MCFVNKGLQAAGTGLSSLFKTATSQAATIFGAANAEFNKVVSALNPVVAGGPGQNGWSAAQTNATNTQIINQNAAAIKNAGVAVRSDIAGAGGGNIALPSGANIATEEALAAAGAESESSNLTNATIANKTQGQQNWEFATKAAEAAPDMFNPATSATNAATGAGSADLTAQQDINNASNSWQQMVVAGLSDAATVASVGIAGAVAAPKASGVTQPSWMPANPVPGQAYYPGGSGGSTGGSPSAPTGSSGLVGSVPGF
jgi:hypothetical protein